VGNNSDSHELLSVVTAIHHERVGETLDDRALCLSEPLLGVSAGRVGDVDGCADLDVVAGEEVSYWLCLLVHSAVCNDLNAHCCARSHTSSQTQ
jgi:hypothetical protein